MHKASLAIAYVAQAHDAEVISLGTLGTRQANIDQLVRTLHSKATSLVLVYEEEQVKTWRLRPVVEVLQALRGVQVTVAVTIVAALGDLTRFENPRQWMKYLGSIPSAYSSGERRRQGSITKAGHTRARRALVEGAWAYRYPANLRRHVQLRFGAAPKADPKHQLEGASAAVQTLSPPTSPRQTRQPGGGRHCRELVGFLWAVAKQVPVTP